MVKRPKNAHAKSGCLRGLTQKLRKKAPARHGAGEARSTRASGFSQTNARHATAMGTANNAYENVRELTVLPASTMPNVPPAVVPAPTNPDTVPRSCSGNRSAMMVVSDACMEFKDAPASTQKKVIDQSV